MTVDNPLLSGHVVYGRTLLPGVGYVDLVLQVLAKQGYAMPEVELRNLTILSPLVVERGEPVLITVKANPTTAGGWRIEVRSRRSPDDGDVLHATVTARVAADPPTAPGFGGRRLPLPITEAARLLPLADVYAWVRERELVHSGLMKVDGIVHHRATDTVVALELPPEHLSSASSFLFHPALFEAGLLGGGVGMHVLDEERQGDELYLPLVFETFRATAPLGQRCFVRVPTASARRDDELFRLAVEFYDESGVQIAEIGQLVAKRVRAAESLDVRGEPAPAGVTTVPAGPAHPAAGQSQDARSALRELVAARLDLPSSQVDVDCGFYELGLTSAQLVSLVPELENRLDRSLSPTIVFEHRSIAELAEVLQDAAQPGANDTNAVDRVAAARAVLIDEIATLLDVPVGEVDPGGEFGDFGLEVTGLARLAARLSDRYGPAVTSAILVERQTVQAMAEWLAAHSWPLSLQDGSAAAGGRPHPMVHRVVPDGDAVVCHARFTGDEPFLRDHRVRDSSLLPAVAQLEMAHAAVVVASGREQPDRVRLHDVVWLRPAVCGPDGLELRVRVEPRSDDRWEYTIDRVDGDGGRTVCGTGRASTADANDQAWPALDDLRAACAEQVITGTEMYDLYTRVGMDYGPAQRSVVTLGAGRDEAGGTQVLAELRLPATAEPLNGYRLHPSILDGALQATIGLRLAARQTGETPTDPALPFALGQVASLDGTSATAYAWIRYHSGSGPATASAQLDVTLFDEHGRVFVDLTGLSTRVLADGARRPGHSDSGPAQDVEVTAAATDIAIVGVSGRYPEAADLDEFWQNLRAGRDCVREVPAERWDHRRYAEVGGSSKGSWGGFIDGIDRFDPLFFQISLAEAELLDPQERLFLECAHHTLEDAGYTGERLNQSSAAPGAGRTSNRVGVFVGVMYQEYQLYGAQAQERGRAAALSGSGSSVANRVSYFYDFHGPSITVDTMCSSSLTAIHLACEGIKSGQCDAALAGGVNLTSHPNKYVLLSQRRFLSSDGRCRSFGAGGDGYVPGEGVGAVLLKSLERAVADGDHIYGVIKGTALNHGGRTSGYSVPSPVAQGEVIGAALTAANVDPRSVSYVEAHGTGTALGDPIEVSGLARALAGSSGLPPHCAIGSVKSNIGHAESAAGIAGLTKVLLQLRHGELVPSLHSDTLNPRLDANGTSPRVQQRVETWHRPTVEIDGAPRLFPRTAGVSGFGAGGSNAHIIVSEYQPQVSVGRRRADDGRPALLVLSAQSEAQLVEQARRLRRRLPDLGDDSLHDVEWTLQVGRMALRERLAFAATSLAAATDLLDSFIAAPQRPGPWVRGTVRSGEPARQGDEVYRSALSDWIDRCVHEPLLRLWADGAPVHWETARPPIPPARSISLPGYPFAKDRCWFELDGDAAERPALPAAGPGRANEEPTEDADMVLMRPVWHALQADPAGQGETYTEHHVVVLGRFTAAEREELRAALPAGVVCEVVEPAEGSLDLLYTDAARRVFSLVREVLHGGVAQPVLFQVALVGGATDHERLGCLDGLTGLLRTAHLEHPLLRTQYLDCLDGALPAAVAARLMSEAANGHVRAVRHRDGRRLAERWEELSSAPAAVVPWKEHGVYLISGGAGGLGLIVAHDIAASVGHATVVLVGRSGLTDEKRSALDALRATGLTVDYHRADVADRAAMTRMLSAVLGDHGPLTGVLHSAGVVDDRFILRKSTEDVERVLAPKVAGLVNLDELTRDQNLELLVCFSSTAGAFGNPGQADYATANAFMDGYAAYRNRLVDSGACHGRTVSIGWPLWGEGGMGDEVVRTNLRSAGFAPLDTVRGLTALRVAIAAEQNGLDAGRLLVLVGERRHLLDRLPGLDDRIEAARPATRRPVDVTTMETTVRALEDRAVAYLRRLVAAALKLGPERLDVGTPLDQFGMDSVVAVNVISKLEESFGPLPRTLLFEMPTVRELARYFATDHTRALRSLVGAPAEPRRVGSVPAPDSAPPVPAPPDSAPRRGNPGADAAGGRPGEIAIVGISGHYPQADDLDTFWSNLRDGRDSVTEIPPERWDHRPLDDAGLSRGKWGGFIEGVDRFDSLLFGIAPRDAKAMDPQQRLFLQTVWHLLEESGVTQEVIERHYGRRVGVYVGAGYQMYRADESDPTLVALASSTSYNMIANRVSYFFGLEGPSLAVDSMCSSAATAIHLACADLQRGETELAVAGGVNLTIHQNKYVALSELQLLGSHPGSRSFREGDGYLPAEAVGAVLLKPLDKAVHDGDTIHAVIKSTASVHSGRGNGFMTPSHASQVKAMRRALELADVEPDSIGYVETAANGAALSDAVEFRALREVFSGVTEPVALGTVKSNLGHPEAASGIAQLTKVVLQLRHGEIPPLVEVGSPNPDLDLAGTSLRLCDRLTDWEARGRADADGGPVPRRALINSVAAGGSHVSLVVEAPPLTEPARPAPLDTGVQLVVLSAKTSDRLATSVRRMHDFLEGDRSAALADIAFTSQLGREALTERLAVVVESREELQNALAHYLTDTENVALYRGNTEDDVSPLGTVLSGARGEEFLAGLVADGDLRHIAEVWVRGVRVPWRGLHHGTRRLVPIPATAFEQEWYRAGRTSEAPIPVAEKESSSGFSAADPEQTMISAWSDLLEIEPDKLSGKSHFFALGGNSLLATRLINLLKHRVGVELPIQAVLDVPHLADMAAELERRIARPADELDVARIVEALRLVEGMSDEKLDALSIEN
ncbi:hypothetical protein HUW46_08615 [Amycolatopsis sp. CA-230715]|nr:hypothetical protein HUW46_08615 [Amycolatopsis sp. CA-230715]